jgi:hypothetical protein
MRSINNLILLASTQTPKEARVLREFSEHFHTNPKLPSFLLSHAREQVRRFGWVCFDAAWAAALMELRTTGGPEFKLPAKLKAWYARGILFCHHELLNGRLEVHHAAPNSVFGMAVANKKLPGDYAWRLQWADGSPLSEPHPAVRSAHKPEQSVWPVQLGLFEVA